ncbi:serine/threonine-protein kinase [Planctomicrobium piriforme]|uniref:Uncharacterized protein n=1 Tax=Planctomicrobium piriforme TaxID=1576369 RepID=A0A1I3I9R4_9PLAN|nr:hypothetical protein [Planctomicrobium piriforme]SFI44523.1 hypothetical protein SAMN05421753_10923 [Planctomicrobium piriforme]
MSDIDDLLLERARRYAERRHLSGLEQLGAGQDGIVLGTNLNTAIKVFRYRPLYENEKSVYLRLQHESLHELEGFHIPSLVDFHDELWAIEMEVVSPPFVVDFAGAYLDRSPPFEEEQWNEWESEKRDQFGESWETVLSLMAAFRRFGIYLNDVKPGNITFAKE